MPVPNHGPFCQSHIYQTPCRDCQRQIYILQCNCGSVVLFDEIGPPWPKHTCPGIGGSGLSGRTAVDRLRDMGVPISRDVMEKIFPGGQPTDSSGQPVFDIRKVDPTAGQSMDLLAVVREVHAHTTRTSDINGLSEIAKKILGLDPNAQYLQVTIVQNNTQPNESYTALVSEDLIRGMEKDVMVMARLSAHARGNSSYWVVSEIEAL